MVRLRTFSNERNSVTLMRDVTVIWLIWKKKDLASMTHDAFNSSVAEGQHEFGKILCAFADKMDALVPGQSVSMLKEIKDFTESGL